MSDMAAKIQTLWPEIVVTFVAFAVILIGLSPSATLRRATYPISAAGLVIAALLAAASPAMGLDQLGMALYMKVAIAVIGLGLLAAAAELPTEIGEEAEDSGEKFDPSTASRGEFFGFFLLSLVGAMLCAGADDLIWLFLALELTSLPTYVLVSVSRRNLRAPEAGVKYFFLGALSAGIFLYGFALLYGATGFTTLPEIMAVAQEQLAQSGALSPLLLTGMVLSVVGVCFKIAAVPMHYYAADVYEGAATPVTAFLAFVPKTAGFVALIVLLSVVGWEPMPDVLVYLLWALAVLTMTVGNVLGLLQNNVKRVLAYSSIAHSGYMLVGVLAGPGVGGVLSNGIAAVLFYLVAYGLGTIAAFAVLGCLNARGEEAQTFDDISGLAQRHPGLAVIMLVSVLSLLGLPPLVGFLGKIYLFVPAYDNGFVVLVVIGLLNSAVSAAYYLRIASVCFFGEPATQVTAQRGKARIVGASVAAAAALVLGVAGTRLVNLAGSATAPRTAAQQPASPDALAEADRPSNEQP